MSADCEKYTGMDATVDYVSASSLLDKLEGATIVSYFIEDDNGLHLCFQDGRILVIAGVFAIGLSRVCQEKLH